MTNRKSPVKEILDRMSVLEDRTLGLEELRQTISDLNDMTKALATLGEDTRRGVQTLRDRPQYPMRFVVARADELQGLVDVLNVAKRYIEARAPYTGNDQEKKLLACIETWFERTKRAQYF